VNKTVASLFCASAIAALAPNAAVAQDEEYLNDGVYLRAGAGLTFPNHWNSELSYNPDAMFIVPPPTGKSVDLKEDFVATAAIGFDYADGIRTELEYRYAKSDVEGLTLDDPVGGPTPGMALEDHVIAQFVMANFYFDFANSSPLTPFIGGGFGRAFVENEDGEKDNAMAFQGRAGVSLALGGDWSADAEYVYLRTNDLEYGPEDDWTPTGPAGPAIEGRYRSSSVMLSIRKLF